MPTVQREDLDALRPEWLALLKRQSEPVPFLHPTWQRVWLEEFSDSRQPLLLSVRDGDTLLGIAPLLREGDRLSLVGSYSICDYMDLLPAPDRAHDFLAALVAHLATEPWSDLELRGLREESPTLAGLPAIAQAAGLTVEQETEAVAPRVAVPASWEEYDASLARKERHELRRKLRRLATLGDIELRSYTSPDDIEARLPMLLQMMVESRSDKAAFMSEQMGRFFHRMASAMAGEGLVRLYQLQLDTKCIACVLCFDQGGRLYMYNSGYDPQYASFSVGLASKAFVLRDAIESDGHTLVDFLRGSEPYKYDLGAKDRTVYKLTVRPG